jgi:excisionase family DNA binding protein
VAHRRAVQADQARAEGDTRTPAVLTLKEAADFLRCHESTMYRMIKRGKVAGAFRIGSDWRFSRAKLAAWVEQQATEQGKGAK